MRMAGRAFALLIGLLAAACASPSAPESRFATLEVSYVFAPPAAPLRESGQAGMCAHHAAPGNLRVRTSWSDETIGFTPGPGGGLLASLQARRGGDYWLTFVDIRLCTIEAPIVPDTISLNGIPLSRVEHPIAGYVFAFRVDASGRVHAS